MGCQFNKTIKYCIMKCHFNETINLQHYGIIQMWQESTALWNVISKRQWKYYNMGCNFNKTIKYYIMGCYFNGIMECFNYDYTSIVRISQLSLQHLSPICIHKKDIVAKSERVLIVECNILLFWNSTLIDKCLEWKQMAFNSGGAKG